MKNDFLNKIAGYASGAFLRATEETLVLGRDYIVSLSTSVLIQHLTKVSGTFIIQFVTACIKGFVDQNGILYDIKQQLSKLIREPLQTAIEQLRIAEKLNPVTDDQKQHRVFRYQQALGNLDKALSLCEADEKPFVNFLRGLATLNIPGGYIEAKYHLREFHAACLKIADDYANKASLQEKFAIESEAVANQIKVPKGIGFGGGAAEVGRSEKAKQLHLLYTATKQRELAQTLRVDRNQLLSAAQAVETLLVLINSAETNELQEEV